jgi:hypothetical protein
VMLDLRPETPTTASKPSDPVLLPGPYGVGYARGQVALRAGHRQGVKGLCTVGSSETLGSPWTPLVIRAWLLPNIHAQSTDSCPPLFRTLVDDDLCLSLHR